MAAAGEADVPHRVIRLPSSAAFHERIRGPKLAKLCRTHRTSPVVLELRDGYVSSWVGERGWRQVVLDRSSSVCCRCYDASF